MSTPFFSLILPVHNEEDRLPGALDKAEAFFATQPFSVEILVVENGSQDRTLEIARQYAQRLPYVRVFHEERRGKGLAVQRGMMEAKGEYRFFADVDYSMPIDQVVQFLPPLLLDSQVTIASREAKGAVRYGEPRYRHLIGRVFNTLVRWFALPGLQDTQCGFKCFRGDIADAVFPLQTITGWTFDVEVLYIARLMGYRIQEVPVPWYYNGNSKVRVMKDSLRMFSDLLAIRRNARQGLYQH
ncbi:MAG TPA: dolichyl-phosphate beta-glucosyltransferase [Anaerolineaceae bacterium]|nr:dolichyl-phosphate beta-glucosyltransferase [Anaerolineaceae bacterium]